MALWQQHGRLVSVTIVLTLFVLTKSCETYRKYRVDTRNQVATTSSIPAVSKLECARLCTINNRVGLNCTAFVWKNSTCFFVTQLSPKFYLEPDLPPPETVEIFVTEKFKTLYKCPVSFNFIPSFGRSHYRFVLGTSWMDGANKCAQDGSKLIQFSSTEEFQHIQAAFNATFNEAFTGAFQIPNSVEPNKGWIWYHSNDTIALGNSMWHPGEPDNGMNTYQENRAMINQWNKLYDVGDVGSDKFLCECVTPL